MHDRSQHARAHTLLNFWGAGLSRRRLTWPTNSLNGVLSSMSFAAAGAGAAPSATAMLCSQGNLRLRGGGADGTNEQAREERKLMAQGGEERSQGPHAASHSSRRAALAPPGTRACLASPPSAAHSKAKSPRMQQPVRHSVSHQRRLAVAPLSMSYLGRSVRSGGPLLPHPDEKSLFGSCRTCWILFGLPTISSNSFHVFRICWSLSNASFELISRILHQ